jgi:LemA protein
MIKIIIIILLIVLLYIIFLYNRIIRKMNEVSNSFSSVDVMLKKRYDLLPKLVEIVKQYMTYESSALKELTELRSKLYGLKSNNDKIDVYNQIHNSLSKFTMTFENYPNLKANSSFLHLQKSWNEVEEQISAARRFFNSSVTEYNNAMQTFPANLLAMLFGYSKAEVFEIKVNERESLTI